MRAGRSVSIVLGLCLPEVNRVPESTGVLYVVATPIGNLGDVTKRALEVLANVDVIAAEDTRHTRGLLAHYGISTRLVSCHEHNEAKVLPLLLARLLAGERLALVSDAGTPLISDPGFSLVREARAKGIPVVPVPGPNAALCALSAAGLACDRFLFVGFPPRSGARRRVWISGLAGEPGTLVFYEAGNRAAATLADLRDGLGAERRGVVARELTKRFETFLEGSLRELALRLSQDPQQRQGELVILTEGNRSAGAEAPSVDEERVLRILAGELPLKQAAELAARITKGKKNRLYRLALSWRDAERDDASGRVLD
jgi:16S rRNA (cytidine1402-2'-O)-methyltransferase